MNYVLAVIALLIVVAVSGACGLDKPYYQLDSSATMNKECIEDAQSQLSPQWAQASTSMRGMAALQVILACEE